MKFILKILYKVLLGIFVTVNLAYAEGNIEQGRIKSQMCMGCHEIANYKIVFPQVYRVPLIEGQNPAYIEYALREYANGNRYTNEEFSKVASMPAIAASLTDQDIADLAAYYGSLGE